MKLKDFSFLLFAAVITAFTAATRLNTSVPSDVTLNFTAPSVKSPRSTWSEGRATFHRPQPWERIRARPVPKFRHHTSSGLYNITVRRAIASASGEISAMYASTKDNVQISAPSTSIALELSIYTPSNSLILKEVYVSRNSQ